MNKKVKSKKSSNSNKTIKATNKKISASAKKSNVKAKPSYPSWTKPKHLPVKDHIDLRKFYDLYMKKNFKEALEFASNLDTIVRDEIPADIWKKVGGTINSKNNKDTIDVPKENTKNSNIETFINLKNAFVLNEGALVAVSDLNAQIDTIPVEVPYNSFTDLEDVIVRGCKLFFGENTFLGDITIDNRFENCRLKLLIDFSDAEKPRVYFLIIMLSNENSGLLFEIATRLLSLTSNASKQEELITKLISIINANKSLKKEVNSRLTDGQDISDFLSEILKNNPLVVVLTDIGIVDFSLYKEVYTNTWGKLVKQMLIKKLKSGKDILFTLNPLFSEIQRLVRIKMVTLKSSEADHLLATSSSVQDIYNEIKSSLLKVNPELEFNPKKYYISLRKDRNLAFFQLRKKSVSIVIMNSEADTRKLLKHHKVVSLAASVQKFWNGDCCTVIIEDINNLKEVINLLKRVIDRA